MFFKSKNPNVYDRETRTFTQKKVVFAFLPQYDDDALGWMWLEYVVRIRITYSPSGLRTNTYKRLY